jgi:hypothetical protein
LVVAGHPPGDGHQQELQWQTRHDSIVTASLAHRKPPRFNAIQGWHRTASRAPRSPRADIR